MDNIILNLKKIFKDSNSDLVVSSHVLNDSHPRLDFEKSKKIMIKIKLFIDGKIDESNLKTQLKKTEIALF